MKDEAKQEGWGKGRRGKIFDFLKIHYSWNSQYLERCSTKFEAALSTLKGISEWVLENHDKAPHTN